MKKLWDKLCIKIKINKKLITFLLGIIIIGFISGSLFITIISKSDQNLVKEYISSFINNIQVNKLNYMETFKNTIISNLTFILIIWVLGISIIGIPINIFMYFIKAFMLGFSVSAFILKYKLKGCLLALIYIFPHHIINIFAYTLLMVYSIKFSYKLIDTIFKRKIINFKNIINFYIGILVIVLLIVLFTSLIEVFLIPNIINKVLLIIK